MDAAAQLAILVVDDEPGVADVLGRMMQRLLPAADVRVAKDGAQALDLLTVQMADLVLTDLRMPNMSGILLTRTIKARWPTTKVILVSASSPMTLGQAAQECEADGYLVKPFTRKELTEVVQRVLGS